MKSVGVSFITNTGKVSTYCTVIYVVLVRPTVSDEEVVPKYAVSLLHGVTDDNLGTLNISKIFESEKYEQTTGDPHNLCVTVVNFASPIAIYR